MRIPNEIVEKVKDSADIVEVIGEFVSLRRRGVNFLGLCPFHKEKTPSFTVSPEKGIYKCFGCGRGGNVFTFVSEYQGLNFVETVFFLANKFGIEIPELKYEADSKEKSRTELAYQALEEAANFYHKLLRKKEGTEALNYFLKRGFDDKIIDTFLLGYSPDDWEILTSRLLKQGFDEETLVETGLSLKSDRGHIYDRFRSRAMFTIRDFMGRVVGFGARLMSDDKSQPKYINSPQSIVYDKSKLLYGIFEAKNAIREKKFVIMTEGYADYLTMFRSGFENVVASSGTSLTVDQLKLLKRYTKSICFAYDGDEAGRNASLRGAELALRSGFDVTLMTLPDGQDPDTILQVNGNVQMEYLIRDAVPYIDFSYNYHKNRGDLDTALGFSDFVRATVKAIVAIPDSLQHDFYIRNLSQILDLSEKQLRQVYKYRSQYIDEQIREEGKSYDLDREASSYLDISESQVSLSYDELMIDPNELLGEEKILLVYALQGIDEFTNLIERYEIELDTFYTNTAKVIFELIQLHSDEDDILGGIMSDNAISNKVRNFIAGLMLEEETPSENWTKLSDADELKIDFDVAIVDSKNRLQRRYLEKSIKEVQKLMSEDDENEAHKRRFLELLRKQKDLNSLIYRN